MNFDPLSILAVVIIIFLWIRHRNQVSKQKIQQPEREPIVLVIEKHESSYLLYSDNCFVRQENSLVDMLEYIGKPDSDQVFIIQSSDNEIVQELMNILDEIRRVKQQSAS